MNVYQTCQSWVVQNSQFVQTDWEGYVDSPSIDGDRAVQRRVKRLQR